MDAPPAELREEVKRVLMGAGSLERSGELCPGHLPAVLLIRLLNKQSQPRTLTQPFNGISSFPAFKTQLPQSASA